MADLAKQLPVKERYVGSNPTTPAKIIGRVVQAGAGAGKGGGAHRHTDLDRLKTYLRRAKYILS